MRNNKVQTEPIQPFKVYRLSEASEILQVDKSVLYRDIKDGKLPEKKLGRGYKFLGEDLLRYMGSAIYSDKKD